MVVVSNLIRNTGTDLRALVGRSEQSRSGDPAQLINESLRRFELQRGQGNVVLAELRPGDVLSSASGNLYLVFGENDRSESLKLLSLEKSNGKTLASVRELRDTDELRNDRVDYLVREKSEGSFQCDQFCEIEFRTRAFSQLGTMLADDTEGSLQQNIIALFDRDHLEQLRVVGAKDWSAEAEVSSSSGAIQSVRAGGQHAESDSSQVKFAFYPGESPLHDFVQAFTLVPGHEIGLSALPRLGASIIAVNMLHSASRLVNLVERDHGNPPRH